MRSLYDIALAVDGRAPWRPSRNRNNAVALPNHSPWSGREPIRTNRKAVLNADAKALRCSGHLLLIDSLFRVGYYTCVSLQASKEPVRPRLHVFRTRVLHSPRSSVQTLRDHSSRTSDCSSTSQLSPVAFADKVSGMLHGNYSLPR